MVSRLSLVFDTTTCSSVPPCLSRLPSILLAVPHQGPQLNPCRTPAAPAADDHRYRFSERSGANGVDERIDGGVEENQPEGDVTEPVHHPTVALLTPVHIINHETRRSVTAQQRSDYQRESLCQFHLSVLQSLLPGALNPQFRPVPRDFAQRRANLVASEADDDPSEQHGRVYENKTEPNVVRDDVEQAEAERDDPDRDGQRDGQLDAEVTPIPERRSQSQVAFQSKRRDGEQRGHLRDEIRNVKQLQVDKLRRVLMLRVQRLADVCVS